MVEQKHLDCLLDTYVLPPCLCCLCIHPLQDHAMLRGEHLTQMDLVSALLA